MKITFMILLLGVFNGVYGQEETDFQVKKLRKLKKKIRQDFRGFEVRIKNIRFYGNRRAIGAFWNADSIFQMQHGVVLSTGQAIDANSFNTEDAKTTVNRKKGHRAFKGITNEKLYDAAVLQFDFYPNSDYISFNFVFASEDYPEFIRTGLSDVLAFVLTLPNGQKVNLAQLPSTNIKIGVQSINQEETPQYYINNCRSTIQVLESELDTIVKRTNRYELVMTRHYNTQKAALTTATYPIQYDGFTKVLKAQYPVQPNRKHRLQIAIADVGNQIFDSAVFLEMGSFHSHRNPDFKSGILKRDPNYYYTIDTLSITRLYAAISETKQKTNPCDLHLPDIIFDYDSPKLSKGSLLLLKKIAKKLQYCKDLGVKINGYAAAVQNDAYNDKLSKERAEQVRAYLIRYGVPKYRIHINWHGDGAVRTKEELVKNRRVTLELVVQ